MALPLLTAAIAAFVPALEAQRGSSTTNTVSAVTLRVPSAAARRTTAAANGAAIAIAEDGRAENDRGLSSREQLEPKPALQATAPLEG